LDTQFVSVATALLGDVLATVAEYERDMVVYAPVADEELQLLPWPFLRRN
jgi:hypothetical protein